MQLYLSANDNISYVAGAKFSKVLSNESFSKKVNKKFQALNEVEVQVKDSRLSIGRKKFTLFRRTFNKLTICKGIPKREYKYCVKPEKVVTCIEFMQNNLPIIPVKTINIKIDDNLIENLPIYYLRGQSLLTLFQLYKAQNSVDHIGC